MLGFVLLDFCCIPVFQTPLRYLRRPIGITVPSRQRFELSPIKFTGKDAKKKKTALNPWLVGLVVFGGVDPETVVLVWKNAFQEGFLKVQCLKACDKIGAAPMTRACLSDKKVRLTIIGVDHETNLFMRELNNNKDAATITLSMR